MVFIHPILMTVTARTGVARRVAGATGGFAPDVRGADTGGRDVSSPDTGCWRAGVSMRDVGGGVDQQALTVRDGLASLDRAVEVGAEAVAAAAEPVGTAVDAAGLPAVQEAGLLQLGDHLAGLLPAAAQLLGELRGVRLDDEPGSVVAGHADQREQRGEQLHAEGPLQPQGGLGHHGHLQPTAGRDAVGGVGGDGLGDLEDERGKGERHRSVAFRAQDAGTGVAKPDTGAAAIARQPGGPLLALWRLLRRLLQAVGRVRGTSWQAGATLRFGDRSGHDAAPGGRDHGARAHQAATSGTIAGTDNVVTSSDATGSG